MYMQSPHALAGNHHIFPFFAQVFFYGVSLNLPLVGHSSQVKSPISCMCCILNFIEILSVFDSILKQHAFDLRRSIGTWNF